MEPYTRCPVCGDGLKVFDRVYLGTELLYCNNKIGYEEYVECFIHHFSQTKVRSSDKLVERFILSIFMNNEFYKVILWFYKPETIVEDSRGNIVLQVPKILEPDFPSLELLTNRIKTLITFS